MLSGMSHLLAHGRQQPGSQGTLAAGSIEMLISAGQFERILKHSNFIPYLRADNKVLLNYLCNPQTILRIVEVMCVDLAAQNQIESYYQGRPGVQPSIVYTTPIIHRMELADIAAEIFSQTMHSSPFLDRFISHRTALAFLFQFLAQNYSATLAHDRVPLSQIRPNPIIARYFVIIITAFISTPARISAFTAALKSPECSKCLGYWITALENSGVAEALRNFIICQDDFPQACKSEIYALLRENKTLEALIDLLLCKHEVPSIASVSNCSFILTRVFSKNLHELINIILVHVPTIASVVFSGIPMFSFSVIPKTSAPPLTTQSFTSMHIRKAGNVLVYAMAWMCYNSALRCQDMLLKLAGVVRQMQVKAKPTPYDADPIYMHAPNPAKLIRLHDAHLKSINVDYHDIFFDTVSTIDRLQNKFVSFNSNVFMILEVLARLLGISADIKIAMHYKQYGEPPANEFSGLDLNAFLMNDLNPLTYGYLSPTSQSGSGGPSTTRLSATFIFSHMDGTRFYNPICPLEIAKRICVNGLLSKVLHLMETNPSMSTLHYLGGRLVLCMAEYGDVAPPVVHHTLLNAGLLRSYSAILSNVGPSGSCYKPIKDRDSWTSFMIMFAQTLLRMAAGVVDDREFKSKYSHLTIRGREKPMQDYITYPRTLDELETYAAAHPDSCNLVLIKILFGSPEFTRFSHEFLARELCPPKKYNDSHIEFIGNAIQSDQTNISVFHPTDVREAMKKMSITKEMVPQYNTLSNGPATSSTPSQDSQLMIEARTQMQRNSREILAGVGSFIKTSSNDPQTASLSEIINGFSDVSYSNKNPVSKQPLTTEQAAQPCTTPVSYYNTDKHDFSEALQSLGQNKSANLVLHQQQQNASTRQTVAASTNAPTSLPSNDSASVTSVQQPSLARRRSVDQMLSDRQRPYANPISSAEDSASQALKTLRPSETDSDKLATNQNNKQVTPNPALESTSALSSAASLTAMVADSTNMRIEQHKGTPREASTKSRGHADTLKNALENAKNAIVSDQRPVPVPEINSRSQSGSHLSERERINRERERLQKEREMLMHEVERPTSTHVPRNERLIKIMRDMDADASERSSTLSDVPPELFNDSNPNLARDIDTVYTGQVRRKSYGGSPSRIPLSTHVTQASTVNAYSTKIPFSRFSGAAQEIKEPKAPTRELPTPTLDSLLSKDLTTDPEPTVPLDPRFDGLRQRLAAMAGPSRTDSTVKPVSKQQTVTATVAAPPVVQRRATVSGKVSSNTTKVMSSPRALSFDRERKVSLGSIPQSIRAAAHDDPVSTPTVESITSNMRSVNSNNAYNNNTYSASHIPSVTAPELDGPVSRTSSSISRGRQSAGSRRSIDATSVATTMASRSRRGSITDQMPRRNMQGEDAAKLSDADPNNINFQVYSSGINSPHPMSMSVELRDVISGHGPADHSPIKPTNTMSSNTSLRQMIRQKNKTDYFN
ncbi:Phosphorylase B kinase gamma catalytic chain [Giardia lamblia P15]|uniref:Phosphorylase B kinase gamma catalytic chain n=1 Tax=Giardia intestinalis (strain P15) TaxID=658858 RepID=E1F097_GIAIA|nr:Phosphorylase B kinase gamma catalytic chain [Giardia lamblia P15]